LWIGVAIAVVGVLLFVLFVVVYRTRRGVIKLGCGLGFHILEIPGLCNEVGEGVSNKNIALFVLVLVFVLFVSSKSRRGVAAERLESVLVYAYAYVFVVLDGAGVFVFVIDGSGLVRGLSCCCCWCCATNGEAGGEDADAD
jgi:hypothetical protein